MMTIVEKIFAHKIGKAKVSAGDTVFAPLDLILGTEIASPLSIKVFEEIGADAVFDSSKLVFINDHFVPAKDIASANMAKMTKNFAAKYHIENYFEVGRCGICHISVPEKGFVVPGDIVIGADSHTCTYGALGAFATGMGSTDIAASWVLGELWFKVPESIKVVFKGTLNNHVTGKDLILYLIGRIGVAGAIYKALEFCGPVIESMGMSDRFTICNMAIECGAKAGVIAADNVTKGYLKGRTKREGLCLKPDKDARYADEIEIDVTKIEPLVAMPYSPENVAEASEMKEVNLDQVVIGSCTNGRIDDFRIAYRILKDKQVNNNVRLILIPGSPEVLREMITENMLDAFVRAGAVIGPSTCGPCIGGHMGVLGDNEVGLYTTNRNFKGRNGAITSKVYLCNPAVAAYSAIVGKIAVPGY